MRGANHDRPMIRAGPTPKSDIRPVTRGKPEELLDYWSIASKLSLPITVDAAAKLWTSYSS